MKSDIAELARTRPLIVGILLYPGVEVLDFAGPFEVFSVAGRILANPHVLFQVITIAADKKPLAARHGLCVMAAAEFSAHPPLDILIVPGGVVTAARQDAALIGWIGANAAKAALTASVCTGAFLLAQAGVLQDRRVTTHWEDIADLRAQFPRLTVLEDVPFVEDADVITSAGISAGIDMSLHLAARIAGEEAARRTARQMQYRYAPNDGRNTPRR